MRRPFGVICFIGLVVLLLFGCGRNRETARGLSGDNIQQTSQQPESILLSTALDELKAMPTPDGVDEALFEKLKEALRAALVKSAESRGETTAAGKFISKPPVGESNRVNDLAIVDNGGGAYTLSWSYRNVGDYDQNGTVEVADITPLAMHFGEEAGATNEWIDGDGDGTINIQDLTPLAMNSLCEVAQYSVEASSTLEGEYSEIGNVAFSAVTGDGRKHFELSLTPEPGVSVRVVPIDSTAERGSVGNAVQVPIPPGRGDWWMYMHDAAHTGRSSIVGAQNGGLKWKYYTGDQPEHYQGIKYAPIVDALGRIYVVSENGQLNVLDSAGSLLWNFDLQAFPTAPAIGEDGTIYVGGSGFNSALYAFRADGTLRWENDSIGYFDSSPTISPDGMIYLAGNNGLFHAINSEGEIVWSKVLSDTSMSGLSSAAFGPDGSFYFGSGDFSLYSVSADGFVNWSYETDCYIQKSPSVANDGSIYVNSAHSLYALSPDGSLKWKYSTQYGCNNVPAISSEGTIYVDSGFSLSALTPDGLLKWRFDCEFEVRGDPTIGGDGTVYFGDYSGKFYALSPDGDLKWYYDTGAPIWSGASIGPDGTVYVGNIDGWLFAFQTLSQVYSISGQVTDFGRNSVSNAYIALTPTCRSALTDDAGYYFFHDVEPGTYTIRASMIGSTFVPGATAVTITNTDLCEIDFTKATPAGRGDWWTFGRDQKHQHRSPYIGPQTANLRWKYSSFGSSLSPPVIDASGNLYCQEDGSYQNYLYAIKPDGSLLWKSSTESGLHYSPSLGSDGTIYTCIYSKVLAFAPDGYRKWAYRTSDGWGNIAVSPDDTIYFAKRRCLYALNPYGSLKWDFPSQSEFQMSSAIADDGTVYVGGDNVDYLYNSRATIFAIQPTGKFIWQLGIPASYISGITLGDDGTLFISDYSTSLYAINPDGTQKWVYVLPQKQPYTSCSIGNDGSIYIVTRDGYLFAVNDEGGFMWMFYVGESSYDNTELPPAVGADGTLYLGSCDGNIYAINPDGSSKWTYDTSDDDVYSQGQAIAEDGTLYVTMGLDLYAFAD